MSERERETEEADQFETPKQACEALGCGMTFLYQRLASGEIAAFKLGTATRISVASRRAYQRSLPRFGMPDAPKVPMPAQTSEARAERKRRGRPPGSKDTIPRQRRASTKSSTEGPSTPP